MAKGQGVLSTTSEQGKHSQIQSAINCPKLCLFRDYTTNQGRQERCKLPIVLEIITLILTINVGRLPFVYGLCSIIKNIHVVLHVSFQCENVICLQPRKLSEKAVATHSSTLAWKIPQTEEPGGLQSMGSYRVGHD